MRVAGGGVDFVPPAETDETAPGNVLEVVKVRGEEEQGEDEDQDAVFMVRRCPNEWVACTRRFNVQVVNEENAEQVHQQRTQTEAEEYKEGDGMRAESPVQVSLLGLRLEWLLLHVGVGDENVKLDCKTTDMRYWGQVLSFSGKLPLPLLSAKVRR